MLLTIASLSASMVPSRVAAIPAPVAAVTQSGTHLPHFGVQFHGTWGSYTDAKRARVLNALRASRASTVRVDVSWRMLQPSSPNSYSAYGQAVVDKAIRMAARRGLTPMVTLWMAPRWANGSADERVPPTSTAGLAGLTRVAAHLAKRYRGIVSGWEVWNEPNSTDFMRGASPRTYAKVLAAAHTGFKRGDPASTVVFGGVMYVDSAWVGKALAAGAAGKYDVMGVHPYPGVADQPPGLADDGTRGRMRHLPALKSVMARHGDGAKPVWFTEVGWSVHPTAKGSAAWKRGVTADKAASYLAQTLQIVARDYPYVQRVYWYKDRAESANPARAGYGLVMPDGTPTLALASVPGLYGLKPLGPTPRVQVQAIRGRSRLRVNVDPDQGTRYWTFRVERHRADGSWVSVGKYKTRGSQETRTLNLRKGVYRVLVEPKFGRGLARSAAVVLLR